MPNIDISRDATDFRKHYDRVHMQQGRVLTDDDFNEAERLDAEASRRVRVDVIGPAGSPDDGFKLKWVGTELTLSAGTFYVGGLRLELENDEAFNLQRDWLQQGSGPGEKLAAPAGAQVDFVWLDVWQQPVAAVEDKELFEAALGGADTSTRIRTMRRARVLSNVGDLDCADAWTQLQTSLSSQGTLNGDFELVPNATLTIEPDGTTVTDDLCSPPVSGGYLGAENQAIRVQIVGANQFIWGFDNGAPLYRVKLLADNNGVLRRIHMLTLPKDQAHYPLEGQVVELLPWSALLSNGQKNAELSGFMATVDGGYNPDTQDLHIVTAPGNDTGSPVMPFGQRWSARSDSAAISNEDPPEDVYFYMRVWNRGADTTSPAAMGFVPGTPVSLAKTGLQVTFSGTNLRKNDFWIIAVRPETPNAFVPWELSAGRAPHGVRRWIAPLGVIHWPGGGAAVEVLDDCRPTFLPLTRIKGCCTYTVGDGTHSYGNFSKIQDALLALPPSGGQVCVLPGVYRENVLVHGANIKIQGCGKRSRVEAPAPAGGAVGAPVFTIRDSEGITIESLGVIAGDAAAGVLVERRPFNREIHLSHLYVEAAKASAIEVQDVIGVVIDNCEVLMTDVFSAFPAVFLVAKDGLFERNTLVAPVRQAQNKELVSAAHHGLSGLSSWTTAHDARGGLQLGGQCRAVRVLDNLIVGGIGHGITLGSFRAINAGDKDPDNPWVIGIDADCEGCDPGGVIVIDPGGGGDDGTRFVSAGDLREILIQQNRIYRMGLCGIGVAGFFDLAGTDQFITVRHLQILRNDIRFNLRRALAEIPENMVDSSGFGGISLADVTNLEIHDNEIAENGRTIGGDPVCGIFILHAEGADISRNRILNNGPRPNSVEDPNAAGVPKLGRRGGIHIAYALAPTTTLLPNNEGVGVQNGVPAARIHDNMVSAPLGQALSLVALGAVSVEGNQLTTRGVVHGSQSPSFLASTVFILNLGLTTELLSLPKFLSLSSGGAVDDASSSFGAGLGLFPSGQDDFRVFSRVADGNVLFVDNQVTLDLLDPTDHGVPLQGATILNVLGGLEVSSVLIATLDDIGFADNQCDCLLSFNRDNSVDFILTQSVLAGWSVRMADNRMKEGLFNALLSGITFGVMNATTNNQGTHCFLVYGPNGWKVDEGNRVLIHPVIQKTCQVQCQGNQAGQLCTMKCETLDQCRAFVVRHSETTGFFKAIGQPAG
jgi:hypothetical protein